MTNICFRRQALLDLIHPYIREEDWGPLCGELDRIGWHPVPEPEQLCQEQFVVDAINIFGDWTTLTGRGDTTGNPQYHIPGHHLILPGTKIWVTLHKDES